MKVETTEYSVILVPESDWERQALFKLKQGGVRNMNFDDDWNQTGRLHLKQTTGDEHWGR